MAAAPRMAPLEGIEQERFWLIARKARVSLATVFAIAGGHTTYGSSNPECAGRHPLPIAVVRDAARQIGARS